MPYSDFDINSLARYLHLSPQQVAKLAERGKLPGRKVSGQWRFSKPDIHQWFEQRIGLSGEIELLEVEAVLLRSAPPENQQDICIAEMLPIEAIAARKESLYLEQLPQLKAIPEVVEIIGAEYGRIPFAVVSGGRQNTVIRSLTVLGLQDKFETIVGSEDYVNSKPAPDAFLLAAERLGVKPTDCLAFEDTDLGIAAATAAGMATVKIASPQERANQ